MSGTIRGTVTDGSGNPVAEAAVLITGASPVHHDIAAETDESGQFAFAGLAPGSYSILVNAEGRAAQTKQVQVEADATSRLDFVVS